MSYIIVKAGCTFVFKFLTFKPALNYEAFTLIMIPSDLIGVSCLKLGGPSLCKVLSAFFSFLIYGWSTF